MMGVFLYASFSRCLISSRGRIIGTNPKTIALATSLRGKVGRAVLDGVEDFEKLQYNELESRLLLRFGEEYMAQTFYAQFTNRNQKFGEDLPTLEAELECLCRLAYPEYTLEIRDKIASA